MAKIRKMLMAIGVPTNVSGFTYIHDAIELMDNEPNLYRGSAIHLYEEVGEKNDCDDWHRVERNMRHARDITMERASFTPDNPLAGVFVFDTGMDMPLMEFLTSLYYLAKDGGFL